LHVTVAKHHWSVKGAGPPFWDSAEKSDLPIYAAFAGARSSLTGPTGAMRYGEMWFPLFVSARSTVRGGYNDAGVRYD
jgi:hypothetical protein